MVPRSSIIRGEVVDFDRGIDQLMGCKSKEFPELKEIKGVERTIEDGIKYHDFYDRFHGTLDGPL